jgi:Tfp pilus assembly protein PilO
VVFGKSAMTMSSKTRKNAIRGIIAVVLLLDLVLIGLNWRLSSSPDSSREQLHAMQRERDLLAADNRRAEAIRKSLPDVQTETLAFMRDDLKPAGIEYSSILDDLGSLAKDSGLQISSTRFRQRPVEKRGVDEIAITFSLEGPYPSLVSFINNLERSKSFYVLDSLSLDSSSPGTLRLNVEMRTYCRS